MRLHIISRINVFCSCRGESSASDIESTRWKNLDSLLCNKYLKSYEFQLDIFVSMRWCQGDVIPIEHTCTFYGILSPNSWRVFKIQEIFIDFEISYTQPVHVLGFTCMGHWLTPKAFNQPVANSTKLHKSTNNSFVVLCMVKVVSMQKGFSESHMAKERITLVCWCENRISWQSTRLVCNLTYYA